MRVMKGVANCFQCPLCNSGLHCMHPSLEKPLSVWDDDNNPELEAPGRCPLRTADLLLQLRIPALTRRMKP